MTLYDPRVDPPPPTPRSPEVIAHFLRSLERPSKTLTAWELGFIASVADQFERTGKLSDKQFERLERLYVDKTD